MEPWGVQVTKEEKQQIGRQIREQNAGPVEAATCKKYGLTQVGGSRTKVDGISKHGEKWSIKNTKSNSTQVHLTGQRKFISDFNLGVAEASFVNKFFGSPDYHCMDRNRYKISQIAQRDFTAFKHFLEANKKEVIKYFVSGKCDINKVCYNDMILSTEKIYDLCESANWKYNDTAIHLKNSKGKSYFHIQMKGSGKGATYHGVLCHIHKNLFKEGCS
jgi:hypothetical protein